MKEVTPLRMPDHRATALAVSTEHRQEQRHDRAQHRERHRIDELDPDHRPERTPPLRRGFSVISFVDCAAVLFGHPYAAPVRPAEASDRVRAL
jgi:hypothetical protein